MVEVAEGSICRSGICRRFITIVGVCGGPAPWGWIVYETKRNCRGHHKGEKMCAMHHRVTHATTLLLYHLKAAAGTNPTAIANFKSQSKMQISGGVEERKKKKKGLVCIHIVLFPRAFLESYAFAAGSCESTLPSCSFLSSWW